MEGGVDRSGRKGWGMISEVRTCLLGFERTIFVPGQSQKIVAHLSDAVALPHTALHPQYQVSEQCLVVMFDYSTESP